VETDGWESQDLARDTCRVFSVTSKMVSPSACPLSYFDLRNLPSA